ncbi:MAG: hypothetical protein MZV70_71850 [Desulfobacterales bacterium]|nr:hypothetical protein [Desulfobacterales bacterium]
MYFPYFIAYMTDRVCGQPGRFFLGAEPRAVPGPAAGAVSAAGGAPAAAAGQAEPQGAHRDLRAVRAGLLRPGRQRRGDRLRPDPRPMTRR